MVEELKELYPLPCPECRMRGVGSNARIGNRRGKCKMCNRYAQAERRELLLELHERYPEVILKLRAEIGLKLYPGYIKEFQRLYPDRQEAK